MNVCHVLYVYGGKCLVSDEDFGYLARWRWRMTNAGYVVRGWGDKTVYMHHAVLKRMGYSDFRIVDHADRDPSNNTRQNLRPATYSQNKANQVRAKISKTGYKGVYESGKRYVARIRVNGKISSIGSFETPQEAHAAYAEAALKHFGEFARPWNK